MKALVIYDSFYGNTEKIAVAISNALGNESQALRVRYFVPDELNDVKLLIIGSPTRGFRPTEYIQKLIKSFDSFELKNVQIAVFDTRISVSELKFGFLRYIVSKGGYAAEWMTKNIVKYSDKQVIASEGFFVKGEKYLLAEGEEARATQWAKSLLEKI